MDRISAFMDGETSHTEAHQVILRLKQYDEDGETWKTFHLIGDVLRGEPLMSPGFAQRRDRPFRRMPPCRDGHGAISPWRRSVIG